ncbi:MAG: hypothetical protein ACHRXM_01990 [Isosphaerales bacterium]
MNRYSTRPPYQRGRPSGEPSLPPLGGRPFSAAQAELVGAVRKAFDQGLRRLQGQARRTGASLPPLGGRSYADVEAELLGAIRGAFGVFPPMPDIRKLSMVDAKKAIALYKREGERFFARRKALGF